MKQVVQLAGTERGQTAFDKPVRPAALCGCGEAGINQFEEVQGTELELKKKKRRNVRCMDKAPHVPFRDCCKR